MAVTSYPFDTQSTTETQYSALFRELQDSGVVDTATGAGFAVSADGGGMRVFVQAGYAIVRGHAVQSTAVETVAIDPADGVGRFDRIVLRLDPTQNSILIRVVRGTPGGGIPPLTQTDTGVYELPLARVTVGANTVSVISTGVVEERPFVGHRVGVWKNDAGRPAFPRQAKLGMNVASGKWEYWSGASWVELAPVVTWSSVQGKPTEFVPSPHSHSWTQVTGKPISFPPSAHGHGEYAAVGGLYGAGYISNSDGAWQMGLRWNGASPVLRVNSSEFELPLRTQVDFVYNDSARRVHGHDNYSSTVLRADGSDRPRNNTPQGSGFLAVWVDGNNNFCRNTSSIRYKENVRDHDLGLGALDLRPVVYDRKDQVDEDGNVTTGQHDEVGLIAEEVHAAVPEMVSWHEGEIDSVRYDLLGLALLPVVQDQERRIAALEARLDALVSQ